MYAENLISTPEAQADFYPTPKELGKKMLQGIDLGFISTVLEPSAGKGDLIRCLAEESIAQEHRYNPHTLNVDAIEIDPYIRSILKYEFGSARQQEIQHTLRGFEDRTRYDYKLDKEVGLNDEEKTARAQLTYESSLRDRIDLHIVHDDFLTFVSRKTYDLILMNPPFSAGCEHLLKAIELLKCCGGKIRCLLNAETVRNPYSAQRQLLQQYLEEYAEAKGLKNIRHYTDDGYSGVTFNRPGFQKMIADVEAGLIDTICVKDMSRLGRNYLKVGYYTEILFPEKGIRFIAINNGIDSDVPTDNDFTPFLNIMNEWYAKDTSKKIKAIFQ